MADDVAQYLGGKSKPGQMSGPQKTQDDAFYEGEIPVTSGFVKK